MNTQRLHKLLARAGVASLRESERLIMEGRVTVNGEVVSTPGAAATPEDDIRVDGRRLGTGHAYQYFLLNKPVGVLSTARDEHGRRTVLDLVPGTERLFPVGRLDLDSEGLLLITNDGELADRMTHPRYGVHKQYRVEVRGELTPFHLARLRAGVALEDGLSRPLSATVVDARSVGSTLLISMGEGRKRQVRRMLEALGFRVLRLQRVAMGPLTLADLPPGGYRQLDHDEAEALRAAVGLPSSGAPGT